MTTPRFATALLLGALLLAGGAAAAAAQVPTTEPGVRIGLSYDPGSRPGVVVLPVSGPAGDSVRAILQRDLDYGDRAVVITDGAGAAVAPARLNYALYQRLGAAAVVQGTLTPTGLTLAVHDVAKRAVLRTATLPLPSGTYGPEWRMAVHRAADTVEEWIFGTRGIAASRIAFVRNGRLYITHSDGAATEAITGSGMALSPAWHPTGRYVAYADMSETGTQIMVRDLDTRTSRRMASGGLNITPAFSPDGERLVYSHGTNNGADLYVISPFEEGAPRRITVGRGTLNMSPSFSPDGRRIAFTTDRPGRPDVYMTAIDGGEATELLPFNFSDQSYRSNPDWSPDGRSVAFQSQIGGRFQVITLTLKDRNVKQLTNEGENEDPSWAPDGRHLVFTSSRSGTKQLWVLDAETGRTRQLTREGGARLAAWSTHDRVPIGAP
ncbi:MAG TPA: hypothetical protein VHQ45_05455 [Gemmatimonadaceae bacterium]|nr:hypothetical protein [Gemmatimonadaceae bacterium]